MAIEHNLKARAAAGRAAVALMDEHGQEAGADTLLGLMTGFLLACSEVVGWDETLHVVNQFAIAGRVPAVVEKPKLVVVHGEKVA